MRGGGGGLGGPLLCIGDLLHDIGGEQQEDITTVDSTADVTNHQLHPSDLTKLYQEKYKCLNDALAGTSHSWTSHTLELCSALETANRLIQSSNSHVVEVSKKIRELEAIINKGNLVIKEAESVHKP